MNQSRIELVRRAALFAFFISLVASALAIVNNEPWRLVAVAFTQVALFVVLFTESFGPVAASRSGFGRGLARLFLLVSGVVVLGTLLALFRSVGPWLQS